MPNNPKTYRTIFLSDTHLGTKVLEGSARWTWENAWTIFRNNLVTKV